MTPAPSLPLARRPVRRLHRRLVKYAAVGRISLLHHIAYSGDVLARCIFLLVIIFVFSQLWRTIYTAGGAERVEGFTLAQMIWYFTVAECIVLAQPRLVREFDAKVKSGEIAYMLSRPCSFLAYHAAAYLAEGLTRLAVNACIGGIVAWALVGPVRVTAPQLLAAAAAMVMSFLLSYACLGSIGLLAFWFEDTGSFFFIWQKLVFILGGMLVPLEIFPEALQALAKALPLPYMVYGPARLFVHFEPAAFTALLAAQLVWCSVALAVIGAVYRLGVRRVHANGG